MQSNCQNEVFTENVLIREEKKTYTKMGDYKKINI